MRVRGGQGTQAGGVAGACLGNDQLVFRIRVGHGIGDTGQGLAAGLLGQFQQGDAVAYGFVGQRAAKAPERGVVAVLVTLGEQPQRDTAALGFQAAVFEGQRPLLSQVAALGLCGGGVLAQAAQVQYVQRGRGRFVLAQLLGQQGRRLAIAE